MSKTCTERHRNGVFLSAVRYPLITRRDTHDARRIKCKTNPISKPPKSTQALIIKLLTAKNPSPAAEKTNPIEPISAKTIRPTPLGKIRAEPVVRSYNNVMKLPKLQKPGKYTGLYVIDFGDHTGVGFTGQEVAELLESEKYKTCKVYKIHKAYPDGRLELKGLSTEIFQLEAGMFFYSTDIETARQDYDALVNLAIKTAPPCRAKVHLARYDEDKFVVSLIYPAEYDDQISSWLLDGEYKTSGTTEGGVEAVQRYYDSKPEIIKRHQLFDASAFESRTGEKLLAGTKVAIQR